MDAYGYCYQNPIRFTDPTGMSAGEGDDFYRPHGSNDVVSIEGSGEIDGYEHLPDYNPGAGTLPEMIIGDTPSNYSWSDFTDDVKSTLRSGDSWAESWGKDMGMAIASMHPVVAGINMYKSYTESVDMTGEEMGATEATIMAAASVLPYLKPTKLGCVFGGLIPKLRPAAKANTSLGAGRTGVKQWLQNGYRGCRI